MKKVIGRFGDELTVRELENLPDPVRPHLKDHTDVLAYELYVSEVGLHPPERPDGFLDDQEAACWERWRDAALFRGSVPRDAG